MPDNTVRVVEPLLAWFSVSPLYAACMVSLPAVAPVTLSEQDPEESVQVAGLGKVTVPVPDCVNAIVPVGERPATVAVHVDDEPI